MGWGEQMSMLRTNRLTAMNAEDSRPREFPSRFDVLPRTRPPLPYHISYEESLAVRFYDKYLLEDGKVAGARSCTRPRCSNNLFSRRAYVGLPSNTNMWTQIAFVRGTGNEKTMNAECQYVLLAMSSCHRGRSMVKYRAEHKWNLHM